MCGTQRARTSVGHIEKCCNKKFPHCQTERLKRLKNRNSTKNEDYNIDEDIEEEEPDDNDEQLVLQIDGAEANLSIWKG